MAGGQRSVYLGQFTDEVANEIAARLHAAGIPWHFKQSGVIAKVLFAGEWGTRLFVEASRVEEAREIVRQVLGQGGGPRGRGGR